MLFDCNSASQSVTGLRENSGFYYNSSFSAKLKYGLFPLFAPRF